MYLLDNNRVQNSGEIGMISDMKPDMDFEHIPGVLDVSTDLSNLFMGTGLTPLGQSLFENELSEYASWNNGSAMIDGQDSYFQQLPILQESGNMEVPEDKPRSSVDAETSEITQKPKRGRPRKNKAKKPLSEQEEQEKRQKFLERNRQAASKCRERRREWISKQEKRLKCEQVKNAELRAMCSILRQDIRNLLCMINQHNETCSHSEELELLLKSKSGRFMLDLTECSDDPTEDSISRVIGQQDNSVPSTTVKQETTRQSSYDSNKDSGITDMGYSEKPQSVISDEGVGPGIGENLEMTN